MSEKYTLIEVCKITGLDEPTIITYLEREWITPCENSPEQKKLDAEDLARIHLIHELQEDFGANDEAIPVILHLIDQLHHLRNKLQRIGRNTSLNGQV